MFRQLCLVEVSPVSVGYGSSVNLRWVESSWALAVVLSCVLFGHAKFWQLSPVWFSLVQLSYVQDWQVYSAMSCFLISSCVAAVKQSYTEVCLASLRLLRIAGFG